MKRKIVGIMVIVAIMIAMLGTVVNAASMTTSKNEVKKGETVVVSVNIGEVKNLDVTLNYDANSFKYVSASKGEFSGAINAKNAGVIKASLYADDDTATPDKIDFTFEATNTVDNAEFTVSSIKAGTDRTIPEAVKVSVVEEKPVEPENTTNTVENTAEKPAENVTVNVVNTADNPTANVAASASNTEVKKANKKLPQTGAPVYAYVLGVVAVAGVMTAVVINKKDNK